MKKSILISISFLCLLSLFTLTGCIKKYEIPIGKVPTEKFEVSEFINDNAVYQATSKLTVTGKSQPGVIIVVRLYDNKNNVYNLSYGDTDTNGNWEIKLDTPDASYKEYSLKISDSTDHFHEYFNNIRFGESWLIIGDNFNDNSSLYENIIDKEEVISDSSNYNEMFYYNNKWVPASSTISSFGYLMAKKISNSLKSWSKYPVSIVLATSEDTNIYEWLSRDLIESRKNIKDSLVRKNYYIDSNKVLNEHDMSFCYENYLAPIANMSFSNVVINQGIKDILDSNSSIFYESNEFEKLYFQMFYNFIDELKKQYKIEEKIIIIEAWSSFEKNFEKLRLCQTNASNIYNYCEIIPTYDLTLVYDNVNNEYISDNNFIDEFSNLEVHGVDVSKLVSRIYDISRSRVTTVSIENYVEVTNNNEEVTQIRLIFNNTTDFKVVDLVIGLNFYDLNDNLIENIEYEIINNEIVINLENSNFIKKEDDIDVVNIRKICYAYDSFNYFCNLGTYDIVVNPFEIILDKK